MKIAVAHWQNRVSPVFDVSDKLCIIYIEDGKEIKREEKILESRNPFRRAKEVAECGLDILICGAVSHLLEEALINTNIHVIGFICGDLNAVISAFLCGQLMDGRFFMPGRGGNQQRIRFRHHRRKH
jgi:predicted Fe-Mo cluster-binding NifX family protein